MTRSPRVLFEDNHLLVVDKPAGLLSQGDASGDPSLVDWVKDYLRRRYDKPGRVYVGLVHRLDRPVGGVMVLARTEKAARRLSAAFRDRTAVIKRYRALVERPLRPAAGELVNWLIVGGTRTQSRVVTAGTPGAVSARLTYRTVSSNERATLLDIELQTGRKHQIRTQLAAAGAPVVGDTRYGAQGKFAEGAIALYAVELAIPHPIGGKLVRTSVRTPVSWQVYTRS